MAFYSTKTYGHDLGISCAFRQWRADHSHCQYLHGYALSFKFTFGCADLDGRQWVQDFGGFKELKQELVDTFDHKTVIAQDDPLLEDFRKMAQLGALELTVLEHVGCERFAEYAFNLADRWLAHLHPLDRNPRVWVESCEVSEHGANSAIYTKD